MKLSIGIVGMPNVGKSTLFNALLKKTIADVANYPFCTIEPNVGIVEVPDSRLPVLAKIVNTQKIVPAIVEFYDIAGLVKGASQGEGLGNKFLSHIREVAAIVHVVRLFEDGNIIHVANKVDPAADMKIIEQELILADLETLSKQKQPRGNASKSEIATYEVAQRLSKELNSGISARQVNLNDEEKELIKPFNLLTIKPVLYLFNVSEKQLEHKAGTEKQIETLMRQVQHNTNSVFLCAKLENEIVGLNDAEQKEYLQQYGLSDTGLDRLIKESYKLLDLISFLTAGEIEARAWTIKKNTTAPQAAGTIHTDFEKNFIKADIVKYQDFVNLAGWTKAREQGKVQIVGRDYVMQDGDVVEFKVNC